MENELKPCPFCGGKARRKHDTYNLLGAYGNKDTKREWHAIWCPSCKMSQPKRTYASREQSEEAWNRRVSDD